MSTRYGSFINQDLAGYHVAVNADVGAMEVVFLGEADPHGSPLGGKGTVTVQFTLPVGDIAQREATLVGPEHCE